VAEERIAVVGAGLAGCLLATLLARRGLQVTVYERRPDPRLVGAERGRSINLAISARGLDALDRVGLREQALARALPMHGRRIHPVSGGATAFHSYSADGTRAINSIGRAELNELLLDVAEKTPGVTLCFEHRLAELRLDSGTLIFASPTGLADEHADVVLAADGSYSAARRAVTFREGFSFSQDYLEHGYKELTIPPRDGEFALDPDGLHIWPRGSSMMIALPNLDRSFTCTLFWPKQTFGALGTGAQVRGYFAEHYPDALPLIANLADDFRDNPTGSLVTLKCWPWVHRGAGATLALVGDAAHAIVPFYGQGANCALEDCLQIDADLDACEGDWAAALDRYQHARKPNCDTIADLALDNFVEMRDRVGSPVFRARTAAQHWLERRLPGRYVSRYELVSFSTLPYAQIPRRIRRQNLALGSVAAGGIAALAAIAQLSPPWGRRKLPDRVR
jgi:kynurenine 3-monooxygenase